MAGVTCTRVRLVVIVESHHHLPLGTPDGGVIPRGHDEQPGLKLDGEGQEHRVEDGQVVRRPAPGQVTAGGWQSADAT